MAHHLSVNFISDPSNSLSLHDRVQIALAIADETLLKSLLVDCLPPIAQRHRIGHISATLSVPIGSIGSTQSADGMIQYESIHCVLIDTSNNPEQCVSNYINRNGNHRGYLDLTQYEAETRTIGQSLTLVQALALLTHSGFSSKQIQAILHLPQEAWYKSWWYTTDAEGGFTVPFLRLIRTRRYGDGTYTLQYKDFFAQTKPICFTSNEQAVVIAVRTESSSFRETLEHINYAKQHLDVTKALLICDRITELEAKGFISQGISIYASGGLELSPQANCAICVNQDCPMHGNGNSPVLTCQRFCLDTEFE